MKKKSLMNLFASTLMIAGLCMVNVSCSKDDAGDVDGQTFLEDYQKNHVGGDYIYFPGDFVSFVEDGQGVMNRNTEEDAPITYWWYIEAGENERYYVMPMRGDFQTALNAVKQVGTKVQFTGKLYALNDEIFKYEGDPDLRVCTKLAELARQYKIYFLILPDIEDSDWPKCYIKGI